MRNADNGVTRYALAIFTAAAALFLRSLLNPVLGDHNPFLTMWLAVVLSAWYCGIGPSVLTILIGSLGVWYWFLPPHHSFTLHERADVFGLLGFLIFSSVVVALGESTRRTIFQWRQAERSLLRLTATLKESEERLRAAFSHTYSFLVLLTPDGTMIEANQAALEAAGCKREELIGRKFWEPWWSHSPKEVATLMTSLAKAASGQPTREECYFCLPDGTLRFADRTLNPVKDENGNVIMIVANGLDLTEQKELRDRLEIRVKQRTRELEEKNLALQERAEVVRDLSGRLLQSQDAERRRLARELHDSVGQLLAALSMNFAVVSAESQKLSVEAASALSDNVGIVEQITTEIRTLSHLLHPPLLDEAGLASALRWYVEGFSQRSKIKVDLDIPSNLARLSNDTEISIFRTVQECLTNIHRHSGSATASIRLARQDGHLQIEVRDAGQGIPPETQATLHSFGRTGVGLRGMRERLRQLGGSLDIQSNGNGTVVLASLPVEHATDGDAMGDVA